ncbi:MAG: hypothetical protein ACFFD4_19990 [Candidatus Odinarchaeota archaeon]
MSELIPLTRVYLFSQGMAFFLRAGNLDQENNQVSFNIKDKDLNDVLKSLLLQVEGARILEIDYAAQKEPEKTFRLSKEDVISNLSEKLQGQHVVITTTDEKSHEARIIGYESQQLESEHVEKYLVFYTNGSMMKTRYKDIKSIQLLNQTYRLQISKSLDLESWQREQIRQLTISFTETGSNVNVAMGYLIQIPVWKTTYRITIQDDLEEVKLHGWALIDNPSNENWDNITLSLISGLPVSFIYNLDRRDFITREDFTPKPPRASGPVVSPAALKERKEKAEREGVSRMVSDVKLGLIAEDSRSRAPAAPPPPKGTVYTGMLTAMQDKLDAGIQAAVETDRAGEMFVHTFEHPVTLSGKDKALIPFISTSVAGKKVLYYSFKSRPDKNPFIAIKFRNTTGLPLENGPVMVFENSIPAGEAVLPTTHKNKEQLLSHAKEDRMTISLLGEDFSYSEVTYSVNKKKKSIVNTRWEYKTTKIEIINFLKKELPLLVDYHISNEYELLPDDSAVQKVEKIDEGVRFEYLPKPESFTRLKLRFKRKLRTVTQFRGISKDFRKEPVWTSLDSEIQELLQRQFDLSEMIEEKNKEKADLNGKISTLIAKEERLRENIRSLSTRSEDVRTRSRFTDKLTENFEEVLELQERVENIEKELENLQLELNNLHS